MARAYKNSRWWLEGGTEVCPECGQTYAYETAYRCVSCDVSFCSICIEDNRSEIVCVTCRSIEIRR